MERRDVESWIADYERLWRSPGTDDLGELFADGATYLPSPWGQQVAGLAAIADFWEAERDGPDEQFTLTSEVLAVDGDTAVVRALVEYPADTWLDLWVIRFDGDRRCTAFEEWPFAPGQLDGH